MAEPCQVPKVVGEDIAKGSTLDLTRPVKRGMRWVWCFKVPENGCLSSGLYTSQSFPSRITRPLEIYASGYSLASSRHIVMAR